MRSDMGRGAGWGGCFTGAERGSEDFWGGDTAGVRSAIVMGGLACLVVGI